MQDKIEASRPEEVEPAKEKSYTEQLLEQILKKIQSDEIKEEQIPELVKAQVASLTALLNTEKVQKALNGRDLKGLVDQLRKTLVNITELSQLSENPLKKTVLSRLSTQLAEVLTIDDISELLRDDSFEGINIKKPQVASNNMRVFLAHLIEKMAKQTNDQGVNATRLFYNVLRDHLEQKHPEVLDQTIEIDDEEIEIRDLLLVDI